MDLCTCNNFIECDEKIMKLYVNLFVRRRRRTILFFDQITNEMFTAPYTSINDKNQRHH